MLLEELNHAQSGDDQAMLNLISKFLPLIKKYGRRLGYEDAANDLIADFIEFISEWNLNNFHQSSDGAAVKYIAQSLYHIYLKRLKFQIEIEPKCISMEELTPGQLNVLSAKTATWDKYTLSTVIPDGLLTPREFFILISMSYIADNYFLQAGNTLETVTILFYCANEAISIIENAAKIGIPVPEKLKNLFNSIKEKN